MDKHEDKRFARHLLPRPFAKSESEPVCELYRSLEPVYAAANAGLSALVPLHYQIQKADCENLCRLFPDIGKAVGSLGAWTNVTCTNLHGAPPPEGASSGEGTRRNATLGGPSKRAKANRDDEGSRAHNTAGTNVHLDEHDDGPDATGRTKQAQRQLSLLVDVGNLQILLSELENTSNWSQHRRLRELGSKHVSHQWL